MCLQESKKRKIHFVVALLFCLLITPFFAYFIISAQGLRNPRGCNRCGNTKNEAEYCGLCKKNEFGELRN
jgi:multisubunit Na+/H+ antiporter MnhG subunit